MSEYSTSPAAQAVQSEKARRTKPSALDPDTDIIIGEKDACKLTSLSRTTLWRLVRQGAFPKKIRLSPNRTGWKLSAILEWLEAREAA